MKKATLVLKGDSIFTSTSDRPISGAVVVDGKKIVDIVPKDGVEKYIGEDTDVYEFENKLIMPGFIDAHVHYFMAAVAASEHMNTDIIDSKSEEDCVRMMKEYSESHPNEERILGMGWFPANWNDAPLPSKKSLDEAFPGKPVCLASADAHTFWLNTKALEACDIKPDTPVENGEIGVDENGELTGLLFELGATSKAIKLILDWDKDTAKDIHRSFLKGIAAKGITSISEMTANPYTPENHKNYSIVKEMEDDGEITARLHLYTQLEGLTDFSEALKLRNEFNSEIFNLGGVKGFVDGVTSTHTGLLLEPYTDKPETTGIGAPLVSKEDMEKYVIAANKAGLAVRLHCIGDGAVRMALDIFEASNMANPDHKLNNTIEHIETIDPEDIPRFKELGVIPSMQPLHLTLDDNEKIMRCGKERSRWEWPHRTILESGGELAFGTDYPVVDFNPFPNIYSAITRCDPDGNPAGVNPQETLSLAQTLIAYTKGAAKAYTREHDLGTLEPGKLADIVVVDRDLFNVSDEEIQDASPHMTVMDGKVVYEK